MSQLYIAKSRNILQDETNANENLTIHEEWESTILFKNENKHKSEYRIECEFPQAALLKRILLPLNPSLGGGQHKIAKINVADYINNQVKNLYYIHMVFDRNGMMIQSMMKGQSMYTCVRVPRKKLLRYKITGVDGSEYRDKVDIVIPLQSLMVCLNMYAQTSELVLMCDSDDKQVVLSGKCTSSSEYKYATDAGQPLVCRLNTLNMGPLALPFDGSHFSFVDVDYFSISPRLLYPCLHDIASDSGSNKLVMELLPLNEENNKCVLGLASGQSSIAVEWDFSYDENVFDEYNVLTQHLHTYSMRCWMSVANGIKLAQQMKIAVKEDGVLLIQMSMMDPISDGIQFYYQMYPLLHTV
ncbi:hypothetical protein BBOV_III009420 [Babesia bovis T2Bo]|uniref:hypothetical protein n=1 Tax=Babesia bovis T2Bo TaxID=484906 RepID=UPI001C3607DC|nr:hypothetical protein BBOV_III009420 [Babesia bovis T2Bo]EDO08498.2 hypothetical protein BBOV_III009420 [Babesia bovis T2Bo]